MKLLYISSPSFADCDFPLIKEFQNKGIDVTFLILLPCYFLRSTLFDIKKQKSNTSIFLASEYKELKCFETYMDMSHVFVSNRTNRKSYSWSYIKESLLLWSFIKRGHFDIIHSSIYFTGLRSLFYKLSNSWVSTFHDPFPHYGEKCGNYRNKYKKVINGSNGYILLNNNQKSLFCREYNINPNKVLVNSLGYYDNIRSFVPRNSIVYPNNILYFGRISPYKGIEYLCQAMTMIRKEIPDATLTIAGSGNFYFDISQYKDLNYIEFRNYYIGMRELAELLSRCLLSVCPYVQSTQSGVIMTSFGLGKPVVATQVGGLAEYIIDGKNGLLVPPRDSEFLAKAIISLLRDKQKIDSMSKYIQNQELSGGERSWSTIADKYINYYNTLNIR